MDLQAIETKLAAARTRLILDKPFLGALVLRLPMAAADPNWCATTATDARKFYYNPQYIDSLSMSQTQFMLAHEALHCALSHFARRQHRIQHRWDLACDYAINPLLLDDGLTPPPNCHVMPQYLGMTAEEIYPLIDENDQSDTIDQHLFDQDNQSGGGQQGKAPDKPESQQQQSGAGGTSSQPEDDRDQGGERPLDQPSQQREGQGAQPMDADAVLHYARSMAGDLSNAHPQAIVATMTKSKREKRVFIDWSQNNPAKTTITPYSLRGKDLPFAATPVTWDEVREGLTEQFLFTETMARVQEYGDLMQA